MSHYSNTVFKKNYHEICHMRWGSDSRYTISDTSSENDHWTDPVKFPLKSECIFSEKAQEKKQMTNSGSNANDVCFILFHSQYTNTDSVTQGLCQWKQRKWKGYENSIALEWLSSSHLLFAFELEGEVKQFEIENHLQNVSEGERSQVNDLLLEKQSLSWEWQEAKKDQLKSSQDTFSILETT